MESRFLVQGVGRRNQGEVREEHEDKLARLGLDKGIKELAGVGNRKLCPLLERLEPAQSALRGMGPESWDVTQESSEQDGATAQVWQ